MAGANEVVTVQASRDPCLDILPVTGAPGQEQFATPSLLQEMEYKLCQTGHYLSTGAAHMWDTVGGWFNQLGTWFTDLWNTVTGAPGRAWQGIQNAASSAWRGIQSAAGGVVQWGKDSVNWLYNQIDALWQWVKKEAESWGLWIVAGIAALIFLPEIIEGAGALLSAGGTAAASSARRAGRYRAKKMRRVTRHDDDE